MEMEIDCIIYGKEKGNIGAARTDNDIFSLKWGKQHVVDRLDGAGGGLLLT